MTELEFDIPSNDTSLGKSILRFSFSKQTRKEKLFLVHPPLYFLPAWSFVQNARLMSLPSGDESHEKP